jgi:phosphate transport system permease protein
VTSLAVHFERRSSAARRWKDRVFKGLCVSVALISLAALGLLLWSIASEGTQYLSWRFLKDVPSRRAEKAGIGPAMWGSIWVCVICALTALPLGVGTAILLEEYKPRRAWARRLHGFVQLNITNLAGVPSIVYGILGLTLFVQMFGVFGNLNDPRFEIGSWWFDQYVTAGNEVVRVRVDGRQAPPRPLQGTMAAFDLDGQPVAIHIVPAGTQTPAKLSVLADAQPQRVSEQAWYYMQLPFGRSVLAGGLTLMLVVLPIIIVASQEALRAVPGSLREGALALGSTRWKVVSRMTLPAAVPGVMTGSILAMSRAIGEAAPMLVIAGVVYITFTPKHMMDEFTVMPLQIYNWASLPQAKFHHVAATGIIVLLAILLTFNALAVFIRQTFQKSLQ